MTCGPEFMETSPVRPAPARRRHLTEITPCWRHKGLIPFDRAVPAGRKHLLQLPNLRAHLQMHVIATNGRQSLTSPHSDRWGGRPQRHQCATVRVVRTCREGAARDEHYHDRPGHRQVRLSGPRRERDRKGGDQAQAAKERTDPVLREAGGLHRRHGGVRRGPSLGPHPDRSWTRGETDRARGSQTLREKGQEERCRRCGGTLRGRVAA